ncbi:hypothetical protein HD554DRAFT_2167281 [Boletus coccyginus]|nr:hypothetical protein HD554DRAFT_2167281 [Boletus coccyginus]
MNPSVPSDPSVMTSTPSRYNTLSVFSSHLTTPVNSNSASTTWSESGCSSATPSQHFSTARDQPPQSNSTSDSDPDNNSEDILNAPGDVLTLLAHTVRDLAKSTGCTSSTPISGQRTKVRIPDQFNGSDPRKLCTFLVIFTQSYLSGMALEWFEPDLLSSDPSKLWTNFGPHNPISDAKHQLCHLSMTDKQHVNKYVHLFYQGLLDHIKDEICCVGKPPTLSDMRTLAQFIDACHWKCQSELTCQLPASTTLLSPPSSLSTMPSGSASTSDTPDISNLSNSDTSDPYSLPSDSDSDFKDSSSKESDPQSLLGSNGESSDIYPSTSPPSSLPSIQPSSWPPPLPHPLEDSRGAGSADPTASGSVASSIPNSMDNWSDACAVATISDPPSPLSDFILRTSDLTFLAFPLGDPPSTHLFYLPLSLHPLHSTPLTLGLCLNAPHAQTLRASSASLLAFSAFTMCHASASSSALHASSTLHTSSTLHASSTSHVVVVFSTLHQALVGPVLDVKDFGHVLPELRSLLSTPLIPTSTLSSYGPQGFRPKKGILLYTVPTPSTLQPFGHTSTPSGVISDILVLSKAPSADPAKADAIKEVAELKIQLDGMLQLASNDQDNLVED